MGLQSNVSPLMLVERERERDEGNVVLLFDEVWIHAQVSFYRG